MVAILIATAGLLSRAWFEVSSGVLHIDAQIFQTVGQGMLNGLLPYADLFETKPPGIFLLHALSLKIFGSQFLVKLLQAIVLLGIPVLVLAPAIARAQGKTNADRRLISLMSLLFGVLLSLYTANQAGLGLPESYGAFAVILYFVYLITNHNSSIARSIILGILMLITVGLKEPFLFVILAGVILLQKDLLSSFVYPLCIAIIFGLIALLALGLAVPFFQVYLPHMFGYHIAQHEGSAFVHALEIWRTFINIGAYSWWFAVVIAAVWVSVLTRSKSVLIRWGIASYITLLAIAIGGDFYGHHFIFAVPVYAVLWWKFAERSKNFWFIVPLLVAAALLNTQLSFSDQKTLWKDDEQEMQRTAQIVDEVMNRCEWDRYLQMIVREGGPYAYTKHSPYGPVFVHYSRFLGGNPLYQKAHIRALQDAPLILLDDLENTNLTDIAKEYLGVRYAQDAPACAGEDFVQPLPFHLLFRQS
ncbi:MAG: hypothetical protein HOG89_03110 [Candidatus Peribacter sp.]|nr:hypothetical protein [Candidatus Peribacter sp.]MBT4600731.1 hypothetical protein [Candidatus Peribacter sp.]MBT5148600.1 hypothetical protein [Candidatus Peribacter sp.]MBT5637804.1 hypothetical protein [Candidatus Peribacter sp.]MBT5937766.1 hypothetical protein [Candidatus Peribacter sp.]